MNNVPLPKDCKIEIRSWQYRDLETIEALATESDSATSDSCSLSFGRQLQNVRHWYGLLKFISLFPNRYQHYFWVYVAEQGQHAIGMIQVSPFNSARSTWRVDRVLTNSQRTTAQLDTSDTGSQLLRHCFETIVEARNWLLEVNVNEKTTLALYRQNGFQPLAQLTYWAIAPELLEQLAQHEPNLPNLLPASNADAKLLYQLDTVSMPPLLRQVFDRHINDFKDSFFNRILNALGTWLGRTESASGYVFEPQRKAAIGYFKLDLCPDGTRCHQAQLTVHPAYTWLYPELLSQMAQIARKVPPQALQLASADYQPEREEYLEKLGAQRIEHTLLMSRSVWHKIRETRPLDALQLSEMLQGLQPRAPIPTRIAVWKSMLHSPQSPPGRDSEGNGRRTARDNNGSLKEDLPKKPPEPQS
ncbi:GNAT family N-acetyltransferase [Lusitaniella coriacea]|uniref:GNAT family N-acetyltransferase n=1 Tax=Lusitaniella coriacea TaxID=1983105 RepID=UPI003CE8F8B4